MTNEHILMIDEGDDIRKTLLADAPAPKVKQNATRVDPNSSDDG